jgi:hypothetical protein
VAQVSTYQADPIPIMSDIVLPASFDYFPHIKVKQPPHKKLRKHRAKFQQHPSSLIFRVRDRLRDPLLWIRNRISLFLDIPDQDP